MYPSVSFWNPYNFPIEMKDVHIEIPMNVEVVAFNPKEWDLLRQWWLHDENAVVWQQQPPLFPEHYQIPFHAKRDGFFFKLKFISDSGHVGVII